MAALALAGPAGACVCAAQPLDERLDQADAAFVGRLAEPEDGSAPRPGFLVFEVEQQVKGDLGDEVEVRTLTGTDCALSVSRGQTIGLLVMREPDGDWLGTLCGMVDPGDLVTEGGEPRGGAIKVAVGIVILGAVLLFAWQRLRRGSRPQLPGAPP